MFLFLMFIFCWLYYWIHKDVWKKLFTQEKSYYNYIISSGERWKKTIRLSAKKPDNSDER